MASGFQSFCKGSFFSNWIWCALPWADSLVCPWCKSPQAEQGRGRHSGGEALRLFKLGNSTSSFHHPEGTSREPLLHRGAGKGSTRGCCFPPAKIEGRVLSCFWLRTGGAFPHLLPLMLALPMWKAAGSKPQRKQICNENSHAAKNARGKQFGLGGNAWGDGGQSWFIKNHAKALWGCFMETSAASNESF